MAINKNVALVMVALTMTLVMWMVPETISAESHKQRLLATTYNTNPVRSDSVNKFCAGLTSRADLINNEQKQTAQSYKNALASQLKLSGNDVISTAINGGDVGAKVQSSQSALGVFVGFFAVGLVIMLFQWMFLCCCCCCPGCCPSKCCQKNENEQYTKCELYWPTISLILLLLLIIIVSAIGLSKTTTFKKGINDLQCSTAIMFDDIVNGNVTADGSNFFIGVTNLVQSINDLSGNMSTINTQIGNLDSGLTAVVTALNTAKNHIQLVPKNFAGDGNADIKYYPKISDPHATASTNTQFQSAFVSALGSSGNGGIIGNFYTTINTAYSTLNGIKTNSGSFTSGSAGFTSATAGMTTDLNNVQKQITDIDKTIKSALQTMDAPKSIGSLVINLIYGIALGLAVLAMLGVVLMTFCDKYKCRYLMYFSCVILFILGLVGFLLAIIFSIIVPVMFLFCEWLDVTITSTGFIANTQKLITDTKVRDIVSACLVGGSGEIMTAVGGASINTTISGLKNSISNSMTFNTTNQINSINTAVSLINTNIENVVIGAIPDVTDTDSILALETISKLNNWGACAATNVDSWVPSMVNTSMVSCKLSGTPATIDGASGCTVQGTFQTPNTASCQGCIDTHKILNKWYSGLTANGAWRAVLTSRYGADGTACIDSFKDYFGNVWDNYYRYKVPKMVGILSRWNAVYNPTGPAGSIVTVNTQLASVNSTITGVINTLTASFDKIIDPKYGLVAGLNCKIIGENLQTMINSICVSNFNTFYINRLLLGISSFGILFAMCCIVCSGVRHFKHSERKDKVSPNFMGDKNSFENTDAAFRP